MIMMKYNYATNMWDIIDKVKGVTTFISFPTRKKAMQYVKERSMVYEIN